MISRFFIDRPIFASVISIAIVIVGLIAMKVLPVSQYPDITPPVVTVSASYPGASAETVSQNVAAPIENQVNGADNMIYMMSTSAPTGQMKLSVFFDIGTDPDMAQVDVMNRVNLAQPQLPSTVVQQGVHVQKVSNSFLMLVCIYSPDSRFDDTYVANYANLYVLDALKRVKGANQSSIMGMPDYAMRIWLKPDQMAQLGITANEVADAISKQNQQYAVGRLGQPPMNSPVEQTIPMVTKGMLLEPDEFEDIVLRTSEDGAAVVRIKDIGRAELGSKDYSVKTTMDGKFATMIAVYLQPGSNALEVSESVRATLNELKKSFPDGIDYKIALDTTDFVKVSINEVIETIFIAVIIVILVVFVFLQNFRATLIPVLAIPVALIGTFAGMYAAGFSINMLTLFGMVLAIGIVVDDAIVVIENVERNMTEFNLSAKEAAKRAMDEVTGPVIAIVLVLVAVFVPVAFLGGMTGQLYKQFAVTIAISVVFSGIVALTLSPALAGMLLKPTQKKKKGFFKWFETGFSKLTNGYISGVSLIIKRMYISVVIFLVFVGATIFLFKHIPMGFVPPEDQGYLFGVSIMPDITSLDRTADFNSKVREIFSSFGDAVETVSTADGYSLIDSQVKTNSGTLFIKLKDFDERKKRTQNAFYVQKKAAMELKRFKEGVSFPVQPPSIPGLGNMGGFEFWIQSKGEGSIADLERVTKDFVAKASIRPDITGINSTINANSQTLKINVDTEKSEMLGVPIQNVYNALQVFFGSYFVNQFSKDSRLWYVILQAEPEYRKKPSDINNIYVRSNNGGMVPIKSMVSVEYSKGPDLVSRFNGFPSSKILCNTPEGYSTGQTILAMEEVAKEVLPEGYSYEWDGEAFEQKKSGNTSAIAFTLGLILVFLILAAQYERWSLPIGVMLAVPFGILGALLAVFFRGLSMDIYFQIGLLVLVALSAKNAILIFEFALEKRKEGLDPVHAAVEAARIRIRPIVMTSLAFIFGCVPLAIATGASANSRHSIGTGVIGGMLLATLVAVFFIPLFFVLLERGIFRKRPPQNAPDTPAETKLREDANV